MIKGAHGVSGTELPSPALYYKDFVKDELDQLLWEITDRMKRYSIKKKPKKGKDFDSTYYETMTQLKVVKKLIKEKIISIENFK